MVSECAFGSFFKLFLKHYGQTSWTCIRVLRSLLGLGLMIGYSKEKPRIEQIERKKSSLTVWL